MNDNVIDASELEKELAGIAENGIQADRQKLKQDMCGQFADPREWIREYVVNAYDAGARNCWISGRESDVSLTIIVEDDGHGMDKIGVIKFNTVYSSVKLVKSVKAVGQHGVGKLSVAAIPGQSHFLMTTSTGKECWRMEAGCLLEDSPVRLENITPVPKRGTRFEITFAKKNTLREELYKLNVVLDKYVRYLPLSICILENVEDGQYALERSRWIRGSWDGDPERYVRTYSFTVYGKRYEVVFGLGVKSHEIYQNHVMITNRYDLLSHDRKQKISVPHLTIRVDSPDFELPFGRHCLRNEDVLAPLARHLRGVVLPKYMAELCDKYGSGLLHEFGIRSYEVEDMVCGLIAYDNSSARAWSRLPVFRLWDNTRMSLVDIRKVVDASEVLYLESEEDMGIDYSVFNAPVLVKNQPEGGLELLTETFKKQFINLSLKDVVIEAPPGSAPVLGARERRFQKYLAFHPDALRMNRRSGKKGGKEGTGFIMNRKNIQRLAGMCDESRRAQDDLSKIKWRVNYLVNRDGKSPCRTHRFVFKNNDTVIMNLNYPEVRKLLELSETAPALAGHWALAMCLSDKNRILPQLTPESREDLIVMDAITKCGIRELPDSLDAGLEDEDDTGWRDFLRDIEDNDKTNN